MVQPASVAEFRVGLPLHECILRLQSLSEIYASMTIQVYAVEIANNLCHFRMTATGKPPGIIIKGRSQMNMSLIGRMEQSILGGTTIYIQNISPNESGYLLQYFWIPAAPIIIVAALYTTNPFVILGIPFSVIFSLGYWVAKRQDRAEITQIIFRAFADRML